MKLLLVRHGETIENALRLIQGHLGGSLSRKGQGHAEKLAEQLKHVELGAIYSSDLNRTRQTAEIIIRHHKVPVTFTPLLRERNFGELQGKPIYLIDLWSLKTGKNRWLIEPKGGETIAEFQSRIKSFLSRLSKIKTRKPVLIVSHRGTMRMIMAIAKGIDPVEAMAIPMGHGEVLTLELERKQKKEKEKEKKKAKRA